MLAGVLTQHSATYPSLAPRIMKTLLLALISPGRNQGTREGAVRGLVAVGMEAIRKGLLECGGAKVIGNECVYGDQSPVVYAVLVRPAHLKRAPRL
jgi:transcription initiation factor TFIID subunit 6